MNLLPAEVAERLRVTVGTLACWRVSGAGPRYIKFGRRVLYPLVEVEKFENDHLRTATSVRPGSLTTAHSS